MSETLTTKERIREKQKRTSDGRYTYSGLDKICICGHRLGVHCATRVKVNGKMIQDCMAGDLLGKECDCECFIPKKKN